MAIRRSLGLFLAFAAWFCGTNIRTILIFGLLILIFLFVVLPIFFRTCATIQRHMVFLPWVYWPKHVDFNDPTSEGLEGARNFYLETAEKVKVGVWHILPRSLVNESDGKNKEWYEETLSSGRPVILYLHGNTGSRARDHRLQLYQVLQELDYHVICFDYRGYADSSPVVPTKTGVVADALKVYDFIKEHANDSPVIVYGHSLGTAVSCEAVYHLCTEGNPPTALVLESPFNNIHDEVKIHPMTFLWRKMPFFEYFFAGTLTRNDVGFVSDQRIPHIHVPILILHAEDDVVVPYVLGERLYHVARDERPEQAKPVKFVPFDADRGLGHILIHSAPEFPEILNSFIEESFA